MESIRYQFFLKQFPTSCSTWSDFYIVLTFELCKGSTEVFVDVGEEAAPAPRRYANERVGEERIGEGRHGTPPARRFVNDRGRPDNDLVSPPVRRYPDERPGRPDDIYGRRPAPDNYRKYPEDNPVPLPTSDRRNIEYRDDASRREEADRRVQVTTERDMPRSGGSHRAEDKRTPHDRPVYQDQRRYDPPVKDVREVRERPPPRDSRAVIQPPQRRGNQYHNY